MPEENKNPSRKEWTVGESGPLDVAVLFVDLVNSSDFAGVMGLREYAEYVDSFHRLCREQCEFFFEIWKDKYAPGGLDYEIQVVGDEMAVFLHSDKPADDVFQLICLAVTLKCGWLGAPLNAERIEAGLSTTELAAGLHCGRIWARRTDTGFDKTGFAINVAKRTESASREGDRFRILVSDPAFKQISRQTPNLLFGPRRVIDMKGVVIPVGVYELVDCFAQLSWRLKPTFAEAFRAMARKALRTNSFDLWIHSCLQILEEEMNDDRVSDDCAALCDQILNIDPVNPVALYYAAQAARERGDWETARLYLEDLTRHWPKLGDGWLELGNAQNQLGETREARRSLLQAHRRGIEIPDGDPPRL